METNGTVRPRPKSRSTRQPEKKWGAVIYLSDKWIGRKVKIIEIKEEVKKITHYQKLKRMKIGG